MPCNLFSAKPLAEQALTYCQLYPEEKKVLKWTKSSLDRCPLKDEALNFTGQKTINYFSFFRERGGVGRGGGGGGVISMAILGMKEHGILT